MAPFWSLKLLFGHNQIRSTNLGLGKKNLVPITIWYSEIPIKLPDNDYPVLLDLGHPSQILEVRTEAFFLFIRKSFYAH
jgi:hypothetical protein